MANEMQSGIKDARFDSLKTNLLLDEESEHEVCLDVLVARLASLRRR